MFGFNKKKKEEKKQGHVEKILMGMIVGGAIGSVLGVSLAPKKGSETRKEIGKETNKVVHGAKKIFNMTAGKIIKPFTKKKEGRINVESKKSTQFGGKVIPEDK
jgi:gas vesicle protein